MDLKTLQTAGGFVSQTSSKQSVTWVDENEEGETVEHSFDVFVRQPPYGAIERVLTEAQKTGSEVSPSAAMISICIGLGDSGVEFMSYHDAYNLKPSLAKVLSEAIAKGAGAGKTNRSRPKKSSGTN